MLTYRVVSGAGFGDVVEGARVRATLGHTVEGVPDLYQVTALQKL
jgi:hypothetical protein